MKIFASDYDGTFYKHGRRQRNEVRNNIRAVKRWRREGNIFVFATGRSINMMAFERHFRRIRYDYIVGLNGGIIVSKTGSILYRNAIKPKVARHVMEAILESGIRHYSVTDGLAGHYEVPLQVNHKLLVFFKMLVMFGRSYRLTLEEALSRPVAQIAVKTNSHEEAIAFAEKINEAFQGEVTAFPNLEHVDICAAGLSKATGVEFIAELHQVPHQQIYGMGDSFNDVPMFENYHGITLPEAREEIKAKADMVFATVAMAIKSILAQPKT